MARETAAALCVAMACVVLAEATFFVRPASHFKSFPRGSVVSTPCDPYSHDYEPMEVDAGQQVHLEWAPMGRAGGFVRLSLVPLDQLTWGREDDGDDYYDDVPVEDGSGTEEDVELFRTHVLKTACFGGGSCGDCVTEDNEYGTTITIPWNLADGTYVLQMFAAATGTASASTYSCTDFIVSGGDVSIACDPMFEGDHNATCWSCFQDNPDEDNCQPPKRQPAGFDWSFGDFCFPDDPIPATNARTEELIGFRRHEVGEGDTLIGIATSFECCCTPKEIALASGWGDNGVWRVEDGALRVGDTLHVPFYSGRDGCEVGDPEPSAAPRRGGTSPSLATATCALVAAAALRAASV